MQLKEILELLRDECNDCGGLEFIYLEKGGKVLCTGCHGRGWVLSEAGKIIAETLLTARGN